MDFTSELAAVNSMLATIGEAPINTLDNVEVVDAVTARATLSEVSREVQIEGYKFNTDYSYPLSPEGFAPFEVKMPDNVLSIETTGSFSNLIFRGNRLYDPSRFSFNFQDFPVITCDITWSLDFDDLPEVTRQYIALRAARRFQKRSLASDLIHAITEDDERQAKWMHRRKFTRLRKKNFLLDSQSVREITSNR